jgi:hypothetical protein
LLPSRRAPKTTYHSNERPRRSAIHRRCQSCRTLERLYFELGRLARDADPTAAVAAEVKRRHGFDPAVREESHLIFQNRRPGDGSAAALAALAPDGVQVRPLVANGSFCGWADLTYQLVCAIEAVTGTRAQWVGQELDDRLRSDLESRLQGSATDLYLFVHGLLTENG